MIECNIVIDPPAVKTPSGAYRLPVSGPFLEGGGIEGGLDPKDLQSAYKIPTSGGAGNTVAIIDAYGYATAESDLAKYRSQYSLSECTKANGCFKKVNQKGEEKSYPPEGGELEAVWSLETALDMDMVSAACPKCKILLLEATTQTPADTAASVEEAAKLGATVISNSYGYAENNESACPGKKGCSEYLPAYDQPEIPITVSSGDSGYDDGVGAPSWPASSPDVIAIGGTRLQKAENSRGWTETVWEGSGSGCSLYEAKPSWQLDSGCNKRTDNDIAAVASTASPVSIYNTPYAGGWANVGGTSAGAPLVGGIEAQAEKAARELGAEVFYGQPSAEFDVTSGNNGSCGGSYLCTAGTGYDGPTGMGTPDGIPSTLLAAENSSPTVIRDSSNEKWVWYVDQKHEIAVWAYSPSVGWINSEFGGSVATGTSPFAVRGSEGNQNIYYVGSKDAIWTWSYNASTNKWTDIELGGSAAEGTSPTAVRISTGEQWVYYVNSKHEIGYWAYSGAAWSGGTLGGSVMAGTSPTVVRGSEGNQYVYYIGSKGAIWAWSYNASSGKWIDVELGGTAAEGTSPTAILKTSSEQWVWYVTSKHEIAAWAYTSGTGWVNGVFGGSVTTGTTRPAVVRSSEGNQNVDYVSSKGAIWTWSYNASTNKWTDIELGGSAASNTSPATVLDESTGNQFLYYANSSFPIWVWEYSGSEAKWTDSELP